MTKGRVDAAEEPEKKKGPKPCGATMESKAVPGHTHQCLGVHDAGDHLCADDSCRRYFFSRVDA